MNASERPSIAAPTMYRGVKIGVAVVLTLVIIAGFLGTIPRLDILEESARNLYFHVPMWFSL
ncbi:MAG: cytochrome C assembly protein, partial [Bacteroidetes bacterium QH_10_64_19]